MNARILHKSLPLPKALFFITALLPVMDVVGQVPLETFQCPVHWQERTLLEPFAGGLNAPQFSTADLNNDGLADLVVFDRAGDVVLPFLRVPEGNGWRWQLAREYARHFPPLTSWCLLRDYDGDGIMDLFAFSERSKNGFRAYRGRYLNDTLTFDIYPVWGTTDNIFTFKLPNGSSTQIYVAFDDIPAFDDIDGDGDIDLITYDPGGGNAWYFRNMSVENGFGRDSLMFNWADVCWGKFFETGVTEAIHLSPSPTVCQTTVVDDEGPLAGLRHAGSTLLTLDMNDNGLKDLLIGDVSFNNLSLLTNGGTPQNAWMIAQDTFWPSYDVPVQMPYFPAAYHVDLDFDGVRDIIVAPNSPVGALDTGQVWFYRNEGTGQLPDFRLQRRDALVRDMLDLGTGSRPAFLDVDGDGLLDLLVGNFGFYNPAANFKPAIVYLRNTGSASHPEFTLEDLDFLGMSAYGLNFVFHFAPAAGDLDGDGDTDLIIGHANGSLFFVENLAGPANPPVFATPQADYQGISVGSYSVPQIVDVNGDGLMDLLIGANVGNVRYFQNQGAPGAPAFVANASTPPNSGFFGQIDMRHKTTFSGRAAPWLYRTETGMEMVVGSNYGDVRRYQVIPGDLNAKFPVLDSIYPGYRDGFETTPTMVDLDSDGHYELVIGNLRGGLTAYRTGKAVVNTIQPVQPGPLRWSAAYRAGDKQIAVTLTDERVADGQIQVWDVLGRRLWSSRIGLGESLVPAGTWPPGAVFIQLQSGPHGGTERMFIF